MHALDPRTGAGSCRMTMPGHRVGHPGVGMELNPSAELLLDVRGLALDVLEPAAHEEGLLGGVVVVAVSDLREGLDRLAQRHERTLEPGEGLGHERVLRQEAL